VWRGVEYGHDNVVEAKGVTPLSYTQISQSWQCVAGTCTTTLGTCTQGNFSQQRYAIVSDIAKKCGTIAAAFITLLICKQSCMK
jgi:hypothetical protein